MLSGSTIKLGHTVNAAMSQNGFAQVLQNFCNLFIKWFLFRELQRDHLFSSKRWRKGRKMGLPISAIFSAIFKSFC